MVKNILLAFALLIALGMRLYSADVANYSYFILAGFALLGRTQLIQALFVLWFFSFIGPDLAPEPSAASIGRYITIGGALVSLMLNKRGSFINVSFPVLTTLILGSFICIHSVLFSQILDVSLLKTLSWVTVMSVLLSAWKSLDFLERTQLERQLFGSLAVLVLLCLPLVFTDIGYIRNGYAFQGVLDSSQSFGLVTILLGSWLIGRFSETVRYRWLEMILMCLCLLLTVMSGTRTAGFALVLAASLASIIFYFNKATIWTFIRTFIVMLTIALGVWVTAADQLISFINKKDNVSNVLEIGEASRGVLVYPMIANISENPFTGIGFGVASLPTHRTVKRENILGFPTSAPIEKGVMPIAVWEEMGVAGFFAVVLWLWMIYRRSFKSGFSTFLVATTILFTNLGEATLFSVGGMGLLFLIFIAWAATGRQCYAYVP